ncbi:MAG TPA: IPT/TIG domain-containing protein [Longimicrobiales bacterium]
MSFRLSVLRPALGLAIAAGLAACDDPAEPRTPGLIEPLTPSPIPASASSSVPLAVRVTDRSGAPLAGVRVDWSVLSGGGTISGGASGQDGRAEAVWVLGPLAGEQRAQAVVEGAGSVLFTADAQPVEAPVIAAIEPAVLRPGTIATITGSGFSPTPAGNAVTVNGAPATVTDASPTRLTITVPSRSLLPCEPTRPVPVEVTVAGAAGTLDHPLDVAIPRSLGPGESILILDGDEIRCNELASGGGRYVIGVINTSTAPAAQSAFRLRGASVATTAQPPAMAGLDAAVAAQATAAPRATAARRAASPARPQPLAGAPSDATVRELRRRAQAHEGVLRLNLALLRRLGPRTGAPQAARALASARVAAAAAAAPPPAVGDTIRFRVPDLDAKNQCDSFVEAVGRVVYSGTRAVVLEDRNAPLAGRMDSLYVKLGEEYDGVMHALITQNFGDPLKLDGATDDNGRVYMLFTEVVNDFDGNVFAFVFSGDLFPRQQCSQSNVAEIFYGSVPTRLGGGGSSWLDVSSTASWYRFTRGVLIHEVKHVASFAERISRGGRPEDVWLEESTARIAEELLMRPLFGLAWKGNARFEQGMRCAIEVEDPGCEGKPYGMLPAFVDLGNYMEENERRTPLGSVGTGDASFYGSGWALVRWAVDHYAADEAAFLRALTQEPNLAGVANLSARTDRPFAELLADFTLALALDDRPGFTPQRPQLRMPSWHLPDVFAGLNESRPLEFPRPYPLAPRAIAFGDFAVDVPALRAGTASIFELSGTQAAPQLVELTTQGGGPPPATLRLHIARVE